MSWLLGAKALLRYPFLPGHAPGSFCLEKLDEQ